MAPTKRSKTLANTTTPKKPKSSTHVVDPNPNPAYADQSSSRLMTLPKEIRNIIYTYVFCDNIDYVREPVRYDAEGNAVMSDVPRSVHLDQSSPPSKETILACRELYSDMKEMHAAAYREYWSNNRFIYGVQHLGAARIRPAGNNLQRVQQFCLMIRDLRVEYHLHIAFEGGSWDSWLLPEDDRVLEFHDPRSWTEIQSTLANTGGQVHRVQNRHSWRSRPSLGSRAYA